jgi:hypothetical protein
MASTAPFGGTLMNDAVAPVSFTTSVAEGLVEAGVPFWKFHQPAPDPDGSEPLRSHEAEAG